MLDFNKPFTILTHDGKMHADDVLATSLLILGGVYTSQDADTTDVYRGTLPAEQVVSPVVTIDTGRVYDHERLMYDHHQYDGPKYPSGIKYAACSLVWDHYGAEIITQCAKALFNVELSPAEVDRVFYTVDAMLEGIAAIDNGQAHLLPGTRTTIPDLTTIVGLFNTTEPSGPEAEDDEFYLSPYNNDGTTDEDAYDEFIDVVKIVSQIMHKLLITKIRNTLSAVKAVTTLDDADENGIAIFDVALPWISAIVDQWDRFSNIMLVVMYNKQRDAWLIQSAPGDRDNLQAIRCKMPEAWKTQSIEETRASLGIESLTFIHASGHMAYARTKEDALEFANMWVGAHNALLSLGVAK